MAIIGIGSDFVNMQRIEKTIEKYGMRFLIRVYNPEEIAHSETKKNKHSAFARNFAAKEACLKALGTGLARGVTWQDVILKHYLSGKPFIELKSKAHNYLKKMLPPKHDAIIHVTITDDYPWAQAFVIIESLYQGENFIENTNKVRKKSEFSKKSLKMKHIN